MGTTAIIALVLGIVGLLSSVGTGVASYMSQDKTNQQNQANYEDWKAYNSPANQMDRLVSAGLNPYMVNGVSNTLSQPFQIGQNTGIAQLFSALSNSAFGSASAFNSAQQTDIKNDQLELNKLGLEVRKDMAEVARKKGDALAALYWSQGSIADLNSKFLADTLGSRTEYLKTLNDLKLSFYQDYYPSLLEQMASKTSLLDQQNSNLVWNRSFQAYKLQKDIEQRVADRLLRDKFGIMANDLGWYRAGQDAINSDRRLNIQRDYYNLADSKYWRDLGISLLNLIKR